MTRREFSMTAASAAAVRAAGPERPNIVYIILDDLGLYNLGCYGSRTVRTPNIDRLASEGIRMTQAYSGCTVCAPARSTLLTGTHMGHTSVRRNTGGTPLQAGDFTIAEMLKEAGYRCGGFGKWGVAELDTDGVPEKHGFDRFFGYYHQVHAHQFYPEYLIDTGKKVPLPGNAGFYSGKPKEGAVSLGDRQFSPYLIFDEMKRFIRENKDRPFFCYAPWTVPHGRYEIPDNDPAWLMYRDKPWKPDAKLYAAYCTLADRLVGETLALLDELRLRSKTLVFFCSDNGAPTAFEGELDSVGRLSGTKTSLYEGGIRIPLLARWPGRIKPGSTSDLPVYFPDIMPTLAEATGTSRSMPSRVDGMSILPELEGRRKLDRERPMYWEWNDAHFAPYVVKRQACRRGRWKIVRHDTAKPWELYDLVADPSEKNNVAAQHPKLVEELARWVAANRTDPPPQEEPPKPDGRQWR